jgi:glycine/D-amino acid oxidase-like deaminating enzyme
MNADVVVIGGGTVGAAIAYGLVKRDLSVVVLDGGDRDLRAASANFGLVWSQGKGLDMPAYQQLTRGAADAWGAYSKELGEAVGLDLQFEQPGGLTFCLGKDEFEQRSSKLMRLHNQLGADERDWMMLDRDAVAAMLPGVTLGAAVTGASFSRRDGHVNPLFLLSALHTEVVRRGGTLRSNCTVDTISQDAAGHFSVSVGSEQIKTAKVVIAAGLGSKALAAQVGLDVPVRAQRGQIMVTERLAPFLPMPTNGLRQTGEGTVMFGATHEEVGLDTGTTGDGAIKLSRRAVATFPALSGVNLVRQWAGLRIMTPDGYPIYAQSESHPGAFVTLCHSGITLAPTHSGALADAIVAGRFPAFLSAFHHGRFDVSQTA